MPYRKHLWLLTILACSEGQDSKAIESDNQNPSVDIIAPMYGHTVTTDMSVDFFAIVDDEETPLTELRVSWNSDLDGDLHADRPDDAGNISFSIDTLSSGGHSITATVVDTDEGFGTATTLLNVYEPGESPIVALLSPAETEQGIAGEPMLLEAIIEDEDDFLQDVEVAFAVTAPDQETDCSAEPDEDGVAACEVTLAEGVVDILVTATDPLGQTGTDELTDFKVLSADAHDGDDDGFSELEGDCDDEDVTVHPTAPELVDGVDNDCDGIIDEETDTFDDDEDGYSELDGDCNDDDDTIFPGADETLNTTDDDCDGTIDEGTIAYDDDGDCYCEGDDDGLECTGSISTECEDDIDTGDCDDADEDVFPDAPELADDIDNDCNEIIDEGTDVFDDDDDGYTELDGDCNDDDDTIYPGATETLNATDDDCDGTIDEGTIAYDDDGDCFCEGDEDGLECTGSISTECEDDIGTGDCDDADEDVFPDAPELADGIDNDCDDAVDEGTDTFDDDEDGYSELDGDCNDDDDTIFPGADETLNATDDDCDGTIDEGTIAYDDDGDCYCEGDEDGLECTGSISTECEDDIGTGDCDDADEDVFPGAPELADGIDNDCDDAIDEGTDVFDDDDDGYTELDGDCNDDDDTIFPGADETLNATDDDCDGSVDEGTIAYDDDGDCFCEGDEDGLECTGSISAECEDDIGTGDCNDADEDINPYAIETCDDIDMDCDDLIGADDPDTDRDLDGFSGCADDCNDDNKDVNPEADEYCNGIDDDCNGTTDDPSALDAETWYYDGDSDGYGLASETATACVEPPSYTATSGDCNDSDPDINPSEAEVCDDDNTDENCNGSAEESGAVGELVWYWDTDDDGYFPVGAATRTACDPWWAYKVNSNPDGKFDCDDSRSDINPGETEACDGFGLDEDCDGEVNEPAEAETGLIGGAKFYKDYDRDGFGDNFEYKYMCDAGDVLYYDTTDNDDCCDFDAEANPDATDYRTIETYCGGYDWDCDGDETLKWTKKGGCDWGVTSGCYADPQGWRYSTDPDCGDDEQWVYDCSISTSGCKKDYGYKTQACR